MSTNGALTVVGTGIGFRHQIIPAAHEAIVAADVVLYQIDDPQTSAWLEAQNPSARPVEMPEQSGAPSADAFEAVAQEIAAAVVADTAVCFVTYGHPGIFQHAGHRSVELVRAAGGEAEMVPGISALDCLVADLGVDIATGCQILDATALVMHNKTLDPTSALIVFQSGLFANAAIDATAPIAFGEFTGRLRIDWPDDTEVTVYEAPMLSSHDPSVRQHRLDELDESHVTPRSLLYLRPSSTASLNVLAAARVAAEIAGNP